MRAGGNGLGKFDVVTDSLEDQGTGEQSYAVDAKARPADGVFTIRSEYQSRGATPDGEFCGTGKLSDIEFVLIVLEPGKPNRTGRFRTGAMPCGQPVPDNVRYFSLRLR